MSRAEKALFIVSWGTIVTWGVWRDRFVAIVVAACVALFCIGRRELRAEDAHGHGHEAPNKLPAELANIREERPQVIAFQRYESPFRELCNEISRDGRRTELYDFFTDRAVKEAAACPECRSLYKTLSSACREPKKREVRRKKPTAVPEGEGEGEAPVVPSPTPIPPPARLPSARVIDLASRLAVAIEEESPTKFEQQVDTAMNSLSRLLMDRKERSPGLADYCGILGTYLTAPWQREAERQKRRSKLQPKDKEDSSSVDTLFEE